MRGTLELSSNPGSASSKTSVDKLFGPFFSNESCFSTSGSLLEVGVNPEFGGVGVAAIASAVVVVEEAILSAGEGISNKKGMWISQIIIGK